MLLEGVQMLLLCIGHEKEGKKKKVVRCYFPLGRDSRNRRGVSL